MNRSRRIFLGLIILGILAAALIGYRKYRDIFGGNVPRKLEDPYLLVPSKSTFSDLVDSLYRGGFIKDTTSFIEVAELRKFQDPRSGRFKIQPGWNNYELINHLRSGPQATIPLVLNNARLLEDVAGKAAGYLEPDSAAILEGITDRMVLSENGYDLQDAMTIFIPNTYDFYWTTTPEGFLKRMLREHTGFWNRNQRLEKADKIGLTPKEVYTLASIVEKETRQNSEKARVAGLYLNRLEIGMRLQADPTVVFATRDFDTRRVLNRHLEYDSPYNTYLYAGLPPGPICMPSIASIDAVLEPEQHDYLYMCARPDRSGLHAFAKTIAAHNINAAKYRRWLRKEGIK